MSKYDECLKASGLGVAAEDRWGKWGHLTQASVDLVVKVRKLETIDPTLLLFTWAEESCFSFTPPPNANNQPKNMEHWDIGPFQLNVYWTRAEIRIGRVKGNDVSEVEMFGSQFYTFDGSGNSTPAIFNGNTEWNARVAARRLKAGKIIQNTNEPSEQYILRELKERAVRYTGPGAQPRRSEDWDKLTPFFFNFFKCYLGD